MTADAPTTADESKPPLFRAKPRVQVTRPSAFRPNGPDRVPSLLDVYMSRTAHLTEPDDDDAPSP